MIPIQYTWILLLAISLTNAVLLNDNCTNNAQCEVTGAICLGDKCQCNTPYYKPCNTSCGGKCEAPENCIGNTMCQEKKCQCNPYYTPKNGVCFKNLEANCRNDSECWSGYCSQSVCKCPDGYTVVDSTTCERKLLDVYNTWAEANATNSFCQDQYSCLDIIAECYSDPAYPQGKFCKCPDGYKINDDRRCEAIEVKDLSPLDYKLPANYVECGTCEDENAVCISATGQRTCWCRAGYEKRGNKCEPRGKPVIIFPNLKDLGMHDFTIGCSRNISMPDQIRNQLCVCARGYRFEPRDRSCRKIEPEWNIKGHYGLCTHINSRDVATADNGTCPEPLSCLPQDDKHVCSCGDGRFQDLDDPTQCVYLIGKGANVTNRRCPSNTRTGTTGNCACADGYKPTDDNRQCEVKLVSNTVDTSCNASLASFPICQKFGMKAVLCKIGECRCAGNDSLPNKGNTHCYAPLNTPLPTQKEDCPPFSSVNNNMCTCTNNSFHPTTNLQECVPWKVQLVEYQGSPMTTNGGLNNANCKALFTGPVAAYDNDQCQCQSNAFVDENKAGCRYKLNVVLPADPESLFCPLNTDYVNGKLCVCKSGYKVDGNLCVPIADQVYSFDDTNGKNITGINDNICKYLFGTAANKSIHGSYCACLPIAYPVPNKNVCKFLINATSGDIKYPLVCPANTIVYAPTQNSTCICQSGYRISANYQSCDRAVIRLVGTEKMDNTNNCSSYTNDDCIALYGKDAFCKNEQCYCNRQSSFMDNQKCESFSNYKFPGEHELYLYTCRDDEDCAGKSNVTCDYISSSWNYKVCRCQDGSYLNSETQTCEDNRCMTCDTASNFECRDYVCQCKSGYVQNGAQCLEATNKLQLYQPCNRTIFRDMSVDQSIVCDANCNHAKCNYGYRPADTDCVRYELTKDECIHKDEEFCEELDENAICNRDTNRCSCGPSYYLEGDKCARAVGFECTDEKQCGNGECKAKRCACKGGQRPENITDQFNRPIQRCINGIDQIRSNPVLLLLFFILACMLFN